MLRGTADDVLRRPADVARQVTTATRTRGPGTMSARPPTRNARSAETGAPATPWQRRAVPAAARPCVVRSGAWRMVSVVDVPVVRRR